MSAGCHWREKLLLRAWEVENGLEAISEIRTPRVPLCEGGIINVIGIWQPIVHGENEISKRNDVRNQLRVRANVTITKMMNRVTSLLNAA